jgi:hypothetical protein
LRRSFRLFISQPAHAMWARVVSSCECRNTTSFSSSATRALSWPLASTKGIPGGAELLECG